MKLFKINHQNLIILIVCITFFCGCKKMLQVSPVGSLSSATAYSNESNIESSVNGIYYDIQQNGSVYNSGFNSTYCLLNDEASVGSTTNIYSLQFANNNITSANTVVSGLWNNNYITIDACNLLLENVAGNTSIDPVKKNQWLGEATFLRAYCYFILTQYFGKVPLATTSNYQTNNSLTRSDTATVNKFIITELQKAVTLLPDGYAAYNNSRTRVCKQTAQAMLAREYLYRGYYSLAETNATLLINNTTFTMPSAYVNVIIPNSPESIWEIAYSGILGNYTASSLVPFSATTTTLPSVIPSTKLINAFEPGDLRKAVDIATSSTTPAYNYFYKFRDRVNNTDQPKILRLSEMYLIRAEARLMQGNLTGAAQDINVIRNRAGLANTTAATQATLMAAVMQERFVELCFEGHRWLDLIRTGQADAVLGPYKGATNWQSTDKLFPIPAVEIGNNPNLNPQNPSY